MSQSISVRRQAEIVTIARASGRVLVEDLAQRFAMTPQTIRRDLNELCEARVLTRVHGGAIVATSVQNLAYEARRLVALEQKQLIGQAAARLIADNSSLFINLGTTTEEVARALAGRAGLLVVTNNMNVATELARSASINVVVAGGSLRADRGIVGHLAVQLIEQFNVDVAVIGTSAIDPDGTLRDYDLREVEVSRAIIENAHRVVLVADSSKFTRRAPVRIASLDEIDVLVTDYLPAEFRLALAERHGIDVIIAGAAEDISEP